MYIVLWIEIHTRHKITPKQKNTFRIDLKTCIVAAFCIAKTLSAACPANTVRFQSGGAHKNPGESWGDCVPQNTI